MRNCRYYLDDIRNNYDLDFNNVVLDNKSIL